MVIRPQPGPQERFLSTSADICVYGGAAGGGKTYGLLLEPLRHINDKNFGALILRREYTQVTSEGGLWDSSISLYSYIDGAEPRKTPKLHWNFPSGAKVSFAHLSDDRDCRSWQGSQITLIGFDELTHFTEYQFFYMLSRNRSDSSVAPYVRATCNPDSDSWVAKFISWWIDQDTGYAIPERSGVIRYMSRINGEIVWADSLEGIAKKGIDPKNAKTVTFIASTLQDNQILMRRDPTYIASLLALPEVEKERLLRGNWKIRPSGGRYFKRSQIRPECMLVSVPTDIISYCRAWDLAATDELESKDPDFTSGVLMGKRKNGRFVVINVINQAIKAGEVENLIVNTAIADRERYGWLYEVHIPQDPGAAGKIVAHNYITKLAGFNVKAEPVTGSKEVRATPFAAQWQNGNVDIVIGNWNESYFIQMEGFPDTAHDDMVDASSDAFNELAGDSFNLDNLT